jgi:hypothetical protein
MMTNFFKSIDATTAKDPSIAARAGGHEPQVTCSDASLLAWRFRSPVELFHQALQLFTLFAHRLDQDELQ